MKLFEFIDMLDWLQVRSVSDDDEDEFERSAFDESTDVRIDLHRIALPPG